MELVQTDHVLWQPRGRSRSKRSVVVNVGSGGFGVNAMTAAYPG